MKNLRYFLVAMVAMTVFSVHAQQVKFGVKGGLDLTELKLKNAGDMFKAENKAGWFIGPTLKLSMPGGLGFDISALYNQRESDLNVYYLSALNRDVIKKVGEKFGYTFNITTGFRIAKNYDDFMWLRSETDKTSTDFLIYNEDYVSENQLSPGYIVLKRNLMTQQYVPATIEGSYAKVSDEFPVSSKEVSLNGLYAVESRGAWDCEGDYMGGTFLNYTIVDTVNNKILTIDSFVYAPSKEKRVFMMQLEAMISSIRQWASDEAKM